MTRQVLVIEQEPTDFALDEIACTHLSPLNRLETSADPVAQ